MVGTVSFVVPLPDKPLVSIPEVAELTSVSQSHIRNLVRRQELVGVRIGGRVLVTTASVRRLIEGGL